MNTRTRVGKIARLPKLVRDQLNRRIENGEQGKQLVDWLNQLPEVQEVLASQFAGSPIAECNLTEWKQGGYQDWLKHTEACELVRELSERGDDLGDTMRDIPIGDRLANLLAVELTRVIQLALSEQGSTEERWKRLQEMLQVISRLRRDDHAATRTAIKQKMSELEFQLILMRGRREDPRFG